MLKNQLLEHFLIELYTSLSNTLSIKTFSSLGLMPIFVFFLVMFCYYSSNSIFLLNKFQKSNIGLFQFVLNILKDSLSIKKYFFILIFYLTFLFIFISNILGMIPYSIKITGHIFVNWPLRLKINLFTKFIFYLILTLAFFISNNLIGIRFHCEKYFVFFLPVIFDISKLRENRQKNNNTLIADYLLNEDLILKDLSKLINEKALDKLLSELGWNFEQLHKRCLNDSAFRIVVSGRISKLASRQGVSEELFVLHAIDSFTRKLGVFVGKPNKALRVYKNEIRPKKWTDGRSLFRSIDATISGKLSGYVFCKIIIGKGSNQTNSWNEAKNLIQWAIEFEFKENLIFLMDTDNLSMFEELKGLAFCYENIQVFSHIDFQKWVETSVK